MSVISLKEHYSFIHGVMLVTEKDEEIFLPAGTKIYRLGLKNEQKRPFVHKGKIIKNFKPLKIKKEKCLQICG